MIHYSGLHSLKAMMLLIKASRQNIIGITDSIQSKTDNIFAIIDLDNMSYSVLISTASHSQFFHFQRDTIHLYVGVAVGHLTALPSHTVFAG